MARCAAYQVPDQEVSPRLEAKMFEEEDQSHPCVLDYCHNIALYDDQPYCFSHSPEWGARLPGFSHKRGKYISYSEPQHPFTRRSEMPKYTLGRAVFDLFMVVITGGFWLLYLICKYLYQKSH